MKTEGYIANHVSTALAQVTTLVLAIHTCNTPEQFKRKKIPALTSKDSSL